MNRFILLVGALLVSSVAFSQTLTALQTFRGSDTPNGSGNQDYFGGEIALSGNTAVVSAPAHNDFRGAAYVFELNGSNQWIQVAKLTASDAAIDQSFGHAVAIENNVIVVGAPGVSRIDQGVYIFEKPGAGWLNMTETIKLNTPYSGSSSSGFGFSVDIQNDEILVGAPYEDNGTIVAAGRIYVYEKSGVSWTTAFVRAELTTTNVGNGDLIGYSAVFGDNFIVTGALTGSVAGTLHVFEKPATGTWANATTESIILSGSDRSTQDGFGGVVGTNGEFITSIGALNGSVNTDMNLYVFKRQSTKWSDQSTQNESTLVNLPSYFPFQGFNNSHPITSLELQSNLLLIGDGLSTGPTNGNTTPTGSVFIRDSRTGTLIKEIDGLDFATTGRFGAALAIDGSRLLIASPHETRGGVVRYFNLSYDLSVSRQLCSGGSISFGTQTITSTGTYQEQFTSGNGLDSLVTLTVSNSTLAMTTSKTDNLCFGASNGEINIGKSGGTAPYEYSIDGTNYGSTPSFSFLAAGSYTVYVRDANGCVVSKAVTIEAPDQIQLTAVNPTNASCNGEASGEIAITATGGTGSLSFSVDGTNFGPSPITELTPGTYNITAKDQIGCERVIATGVNISEPPSSLTPAVDTGLSTVYGTPVSGIVITPDPSDTEVNYFQISNILGGNLFKNDGVTAIAQGEFITKAEGLAGLVFAPTQQGPNLGFTVRSAASNRVSCLGGSSVGSVITVAKAPLTATGISETIGYGTSPTNGIQYTGFVNGETESVLTSLPTASTTATAGSVVGTYPLTLAGGAADNYDITLVNGLITVEKAKLTVNIASQSKTYGASNPALSFSYSGFVLNENQSVIDTSPTISTTIDEFSGAGSYTISGSGGSDDSYDFIYVDGTFTVNQAPLSLTVNDKAITYGEALPTLDGTLSGVINNDNIMVSYSTTATSTADAGDYPITASLSDPDNKLGNYNVSNTPGTLTIGQADQLITLAAISDVDLAEVNEVAVTASVDSGLPLTYTITQGQAFAAFNADNSLILLSGTGTVILEVSQAGDTNYKAASESVSFNAVDSRKSNQTITIGNIERVTYGEVLTVSANASSSLPVSLTVVSGPATLNGTELTFSAVGMVVIEASQNGNEAFNPASPFTQQFEVTPAVLSVTAGSQTIIYGEAIPALQYSISGFVNGETEAVLTSVPTLSTTATGDSDAGAYPILVGGAMADNYTFNYLEGVLTIDKITAGISIFDLEQQADGTPKAVSVVTDPAGLMFTITYNGNADPPLVAGTYEIVITIDEVNYKGSETATFVITDEKNILSVHPNPTLVKVYPSPTTDYLTIEGDDIQRMQVLNLNGEVQRESNGASVKWDLSNLASGIYFVKIQTRGGSVEIRRIIKN